MHPWREELRRLYFVRAPPPRLHHPLHLCITLASRPSFWLSHQGSGCVRLLGLAVPNPLHLCARLAARPPVRAPYQDPGRLPFWPPYQDPGSLLQIILQILFQLLLQSPPSRASSNASRSKLSPSFAPVHQAGFQTLNMALISGV